MKKLFYTGLIGLLLFELCNVYFVIPMPGSPKMNSINIAYFLYSRRWAFRALFGAMLVYGLVKAGWKRRWLPLIPMLLVGAIIYYANFVMAADHMFRSPTTVAMQGRAHAGIDLISQQPGG